MLIRRAEVEGRLVDVRVCGGWVADTERVLAEFVVGGRLVDVRVHGERAPGLGADIERVLAELVSSC